MEYLLWNIFYGIFFWNIYLAATKINKKQMQNFFPFITEYSDFLKFYLKNID